MRHISSTDAAIAALASRQYGLVTRAQLLALGLSPSAIARRVRAGRLHRIHDGVYAVGHAAPRREARWLAAVLACGEGALLSHRSAATLWRIRDGEGPRADVTVPASVRRRPPGVAVHRSRVLVREDVARRFGIPVTSPERTLVDTAHELEEEHEVARALREAQFRRLVTLPRLHAALERRRCAVLSRLIEDVVVTQSELEDAMVAACDRHGLPRPATQQWIAGHRVDFVWPAERVVVETDGWEAHGTRDAFQADRSATNALQLRGYLVLRFTHADVVRRPARVAAEVRAALAALAAEAERGSRDSNPDSRFWRPRA